LKFINEPRDTGQNSPPLLSKNIVVRHRIQSSAGDETCETSPVAGKAARCAG
jgi:hypothetical protein